MVCRQAHITAFVSLSSLKKTGHKVRPDVTGYLFLFRCRGQFMLNMRSDCGMTNFYSFSAARGSSVS